MVESCITIGTLTWYPAALFDQRKPGSVALLLEKVLDIQHATVLQWGWLEPSSKEATMNKIIADLFQLCASACL